MDDTPHIYKKIMICGHRNPDVDSIMAAYALADLKNKLGESQVQAICPGLLPNRAAWVFNHFHLQPPASVNDVYLRVSDLATNQFTTISSDMPLLEAVQLLKETGSTSLPVVNESNSFIGVLSPIGLLSELLNISSHTDESLAGRAVYSSPLLMQRVLDADYLTEPGENIEQVYNVFVAAMSAEYFEQRLLRPDRDNPVVIVGDRPSIHQCVLKHKVPVLIITGNSTISDDIIAQANECGTTILRTRFDSATVTRRVKFSTPTDHVLLSDPTTSFRESDMVRDVRKKALRSPENTFPVCNREGQLVGIVHKTAFTSPSPHAMILVDHNETAQGITGLEELPILEVVDHHRIAIRPTTEPIKYTADIVGSTCTIIAGMYRMAGLRPSRKIAGILLCGIVTDTLLFQSPTTTQVDIKTSDWLSKICNENAESIMAELMKLDSPLAVMDEKQAIETDRKTYTESGYHFALSQIEETNLELLHHRQTKLIEAMQHTLQSDALDFIALMVTDPVRGNSELLFVGDEAVRQAIPYVKGTNEIFALRGILSRKKQLLPQVLATLAAMPKTSI